MSGIQNYTFYDIRGSLAALFVFPLFLLAPGYVIGWLSNVLQFRGKSLIERAAMSLVLSVAVVGILATLMARYLSLAWALRLFEALGFAFLICVAWELKQELPKHRFRVHTATAALAAVLAFWAVIAIAAQVDLQLGSRLYTSATAYDHSVRAAFTRAVVRTGVPPANPFFFPGAYVPMRYYYYWNVVTALPSLFGIDPRLTMYASCAWCGFALVAIVILYVKYVLGHTTGLRWKGLLGAGLLAVTGLDIIPTAILAAIPPHVIRADMEWWREDIVTGWVDSLLWVPHHVAGLVACLTGFLLLWNLPRSARGRVAALLLAGAAFASAGGYSLYVAFTFAVFLVCWLWLALHERRWAETWMLLAAGAAAIIFSIPYLHDLSAPGAGMGFAKFSIRYFEVFSPLLYAVGIRASWVYYLVARLALPLDFAVELGFFFAVGLLQWKKDRVHKWAQLPREKKALWLMLAASIAVTTFLRSRTIWSNDLGLRAIIPAQFILLLWAVPLIYEWAHGRKRERSESHATGLIRPAILMLLLVLGVIGTVYQVSMLRFYTVLADTGRLADVPSWLPEPHQIGTKTYAMRQAYSALQATLPPSAIVQDNLSSRQFVPHLLYSTRQSVAGVPGCGTVFGGSPFRCVPMQARLVRLFQDKKNEDREPADQTCDALSINVLVSTDEDPVWRTSRESWVWTRKPMFSNDAVRAFYCGTRNLETASTTPDVAARK